MWICSLMHPLSVCILTYLLTYLPITSWFGLCGEPCRINTSQNVWTQARLWTTCTGHLPTLASVHPAVVTNWGQERAVVQGEISLSAKPSLFLFLLTLQAGCASPKTASPRASAGAFECSLPMEISETDWGEMGLLGQETRPFYIKIAWSAMGWRVTQGSWLIWQMN